MATKEEQAIIDAYNRAKARQAAERDLSIKEAAERLALQSQQTTELEKQAKGQARQQATQTYVAGQQASRVLPNQLAQSGLSMSGYRSLAQQKMAREQTIGQQGIRSNLEQTQAGYARNRAADQLSYNQAKRSATSRYTQNIADLELDKKQDLAKAGQVHANPTNPTTPLPQQPTTPDQADPFGTMVQSAMLGRLTYDQFKAELAKYNLDEGTRQGYLQAYLRNQQAKKATAGGTVTNRPTISQQ